MLPVGAVIVDFDGTVCLHDVGVDLMERFGADRSRSGPLADIDRAFDAGEIGLRDVLVAEAALLRGSDRDLIAFALDHCPLDPTFAPFAAWVAAEGLPLTVVSDGFGLHVRPLLAAARGPGPRHPPARPRGAFGSRRRARRRPGRSGRP